MNLLPKKQVQSQVQDERRKQIEEGTFLATKVDALRQELGSLEKQKGDFLASTKADIEIQTKPLIELKTSLQAEVAQLQKQQLALRQPLTEEWTLLSKAKAEQENSVIQFETAKKELRRQFSLVDIEKTKQKESSYKIRVIERQVSKNLVITEEAKALTLATGQEMEQKRIAFEADLAQRDLMMRQKEASVLEREKNCELKEGGFISQQEEINTTRTQLQAMRITLERAIAKNNANAERIPK